MVATAKEFSNAIDEDGKPIPNVGQWEEPAPQNAVDFVLAQSINQGLDGRSHWVWIRLCDGDLVLATYPQGDTYSATEQWRTI